MRQQYVYFLKLIPSLLNDENWTEKENAIVGRHFKRLQHMLAEGSLVLAGRTQNYNPTGIVILEADSEDEARRLMEADPTVAEGIMTAELFPYSVALIRKS